jgi:hypothetical protein
MVTKYASELPLPGGVEQYYDTLVELLRRVGKQPMDQEQLAETVVDVCPNSSSSTAISQYISLISRMGFWSVKDDAVRLTPDGNSLLDKHDDDPSAAKRSVLDMKLRDVSGYDVLLTALKQGPISFDHADSTLKKALNVDWKTKNQTMFRMNWLRSLGYVTKDGHDYSLTPSGQSLVASVVPPLIVNLPGKGPTKDIDNKKPLSVLVAKATSLADAVEKGARTGGDGSALEQATADAFEFLGFDVQRIGGSGNPDVVVTAPMGSDTYRALVETKSRSSGTVNQNDVNFNALNQHKVKWNADFVLVLAADFSGGNLEKWACDQKVRFLRVEELRQILFAHAEAMIPLDRLRDLFVGGGSTDESTLSAILADSEVSAQHMKLCGQVFGAVLAHQTDEATLNEHALFYILSGAHSIQAIQATASLLQSGLIGALGRAEDGSLYCRLSRRTFSERLRQIQEAIADPADEVLK